VKVLPAYLAVYAELQEVGKIYDWEAEALARM